MNDKLLYRIPEVAEHLSISRSKVYELLKSGELRSVHIDGTQLVVPATFRPMLTPWQPLRELSAPYEPQIGPRPSAGRS